MHARRMPPWSLVAAILAIPVLVGCASGTGAGASATPSSVATPSEVAAPSVSVPPPKGAAPIELQGRWLTQMDSPGDRVTLVIGETSYQIVRGGFSGRGKIAVHGDQIEFSGNDQCEGSGTYAWALQGGSLTFVPVAPRDPCPRIDVLERRTYTPVKG